MKVAISLVVVYSKPVKVLIFCIVDLHFDHTKVIYVDQIPFLFIKDKINQTLIT